MTDQAQSERFAAYFPSVFAYVHAWSDDENRCREVAIEAFARVFNRGGVFSDEGFSVALFSVVRDLCEGSLRSSPLESGGLSIPEREVGALMFDAQLTRGEVGSLLQIPEDSVVSTLVRGLRKLQGAVARDSSLLLQRL